MIQQLKEEKHTEEIHKGLINEYNTGDMETWWKKRQQEVKSTKTHEERLFQQKTENN